MFCECPVYYQRAGLDKRTALQKEGRMKKLVEKIWNPGHSRLPAKPKIEHARGITSVIGRQGRAVLVVKTGSKIEWSFALCPKLSVGVVGNEVRTTAVHVQYQGRPREKL